MKSSRRLVAVYALTAIVILANGCGSDSDNGVSSTESDAETSLQTKTSLADPLDTASFLDAVEVREPEARSQLSDETLIDYGIRSCELRNGYIHGSRPDMTTALAEEIANGAIGALDPDDVASAVSNAGQIHLCEETIVEVESAD
ncbi:MAG: hypothetical protein GY926_04785 [bacterium]|nr:hypothetical protein [bacterium]